MEIQKHWKAGTPRRGFTIIELLLVIGIISVLIGSTGSAISGSMKQARRRQASALCRLVEQGISTYYAQKDEWPGGFQADVTVDNNSDYYTLKDSEVNNMVRDVVKETQKGNPMIDVSGLFVSKNDGDNAIGMDFLSAVRGTKKNPEGISLNRMRFGYPDPNSGRFRCFKMTYTPSADKITVSTY